LDYFHSVCALESNIENFVHILTNTWGLKPKPPAVSAANNDEFWA